MDNIVFLILRQMRRPLLTLVTVYAIAILGLALIPGRDAAGNIWHMDLFHAFYFVSFMSTTIGFGEIPYEFTDGQRLWVTLSLYVTVISWIYAIGTILSLLQDKTFQRALVEGRFARRVKGLRETFYLVCGYGETGSALVKALTNRGQHAVVIDIDETRTNIIALQNLRDFVPTLHGDARRPAHLLAAGLAHRLCDGVVALTNDNAANLKVAITAKLLRAEMNVICRADSHEIEANMASFGTDYIVDPFDTFATHLAIALHSPCLYLLQRWLTSPEEAELDEPIYPPRDGHWIVCGYGRFGRAVCERLKREGINPMVIEANPTRTRLPTGKFVHGWGTEADTLLAAGVDRAVGLVAGTNDDANNLSIVMTARDLNRKLFVIVRQNNIANEQIVHSAGADMVMHPSTIIADKIRVLLATPYLYEFFKQAQYQDEAWACQLASRIAALATTRTPVVRSYTIDSEDACAVHARLSESGDVHLSDLLRDPWNPDRPLCCMVLMLAQGAERRLLPPDDTPLAPGDTLLFCGRRAAFTRLEWILRHAHTLNLVCAGDNEPDSWVWRLMRPKRLRRGTEPR